MKIFAVYDSKAGAFLPPVFLQSAGLALRGFCEGACTQGHHFNKYAADFTLFELGTWDEVSGVFSCHAVPVSLGTALQVRSAAQVDLEEMVNVDRAALRNHVNGSDPDTVMEVQS